jgi:hypothetical protein
MARRQPYQPLVLRLLHGLNGFLVLSALPTGLWLYDTYDGRFGRIGLPKVDQAMIDIHGTVGYALLFTFLGLGFYSIFKRNRLIQGDRLQPLSAVGTARWWFMLHRVVNTGFLLAVGLAVLSGKWMSEAWLPKGELDSPWYALHLGAWGLVACCLVMHLLMLFNVGGIPLLFSMIDPHFRPKDSPRYWPKQLVEMVQKFITRGASGG